MRRPRKTTLDPEWFQGGAIGRQTATTDEYFENPTPEALALVLSHFVEELQEPDRSAVQMVAMAGMTYDEAADLMADDLPLVAYLGKRPGYRPHRKTVWKWCRRGLRQVREWLDSTPWVQILSEGRLPLPEGELPLNG